MSKCSFPAHNWHHHSVHCHDIITAMHFNEIRGGNFAQKNNDPVFRRFFYGYDPVHGCNVPDE